MGDLQLADLGVVAREDAVADGETGVSGDHAVVCAGDGHAGPAQPPKRSSLEMYEDGEAGTTKGGERAPTRRYSRRPSRRA